MTALTYIVRPGESNEELRYSLRTVAVNWHGVSRVTIVGDAPSWVDRTAVEVVAGNRWKVGQPHRNVYDNIRIACTHPGHDPEPVIMNDDFFLLHPFEGRPPMTYRGTLDAHIDSIALDGWWRQSLVLTRAWLESKGLTGLLSYELHRPFPVDAYDMANVLHAARECRPHNPPQWRTLYGNYYGIEALRCTDFKAQDYHRDHRLPEDATWMSTTDAVWLKSQIGKDLRSLYPDPSPFEMTT